MGQLLLFIVVAVVVAAIVFGVTVMFGGGDSGLTPVEPDGRAVPLPTDRPLDEKDVERTTFDVAWRGYRMAQVDQALQRAAYDIGYKDELIGVLEAEVTALRDGRTADADALRRAREASIAPAVPPAPAEPLIELTVTKPSPEAGTMSSPEADTKPSAEAGAEAPAKQDTPPKQEVPATRDGAAEAAEPVKDDEPAGAPAESLEKR